MFPVEGTDAATAATTQAAELATIYNATVHALSVADTRNRFESPSSGLAPDAWARTQREQATAAVDAAVGALPNGVTVERHVEDGAPDSVILKWVYDHDLNIVVIGTNGHIGLDHCLISSVTEAVVRKATAPVLTVRLDA